MEAGLDPRTLVPRLVDLLRRRIVNGEMKPGTKVRQDEYAEALGVSRTPLREAFRVLETEGWLISRPHAGVVVAGFSISEISEISVMRLLIEPLVAHDVAACHSDTEVPKLEAVLDSINDRPAGTSRAESIEDITWRFHYGIYGMPATVSDYRNIHSEIRQYWDRYARYRRVYLNVAEQVQQSDYDHRAILKAWAQRDGDQVEKLIAEHIFRAAIAIIQMLDPEATITTELHLLAQRYDMRVPSALHPLLGSRDFARSEVVS